MITYFVKLFYVIFHSAENFNREVAFIGRVLVFDCELISVQCLSKKARYLVLFLKLKPVNRRPFVFWGLF